MFSTLLTGAMYPLVPTRDPRNVEHWYFARPKSHIFIEIKSCAIDEITTSSKLAEA
jgi:hypothetical protein